MNEAQRIAELVQKEVEGGGSSNIVIAIRFGKIIRVTRSTEMFL